jgi:hypothetical protein
VQHLANAQETLGPLVAWVGRHGPANGLGWLKSAKAALFFAFPQVQFNLNHSMCGLLVPWL